MSEKPHLSAVEMALVDYSNAKEAFESADARYSAVPRERTDALNRLNDAQKAFDAATAALSKSAPRDSDWASRRIATGASS